MVGKSRIHNLAISPVMIVVNFPRRNVSDDYKRIHTQLITLNTDLFSNNFGSTIAEWYK